MRTALAVLLCCGFVAAQTAQPSQASPSTSPWLIVRAGVAKGVVREASVHSAVLKADRKVWIYTPAAFDAKRTAPYDLIVVFDGSQYLEEIPLPTILDNLIADKKIAATVAVLVDNGEGRARIADLGNSAQFAKFVSDELIPWARTNWNVTRDAQRTIITGSSAGGLASLYLAWKRPDLFGNVLAQSPALWRGNEGSNGAPYEWLTEQYKAAPKLPVRFYIEVGGGETHAVLGGSGPVFIEANRRFVDVLRQKGYTLQYTEVPGAQHEPGHWREQIANGILWLNSPF